MRRLLTAALVLAFLGTAILVRADGKPNPTGTWKWTVNFGGRSREIALKLKLKGNKLTGAMIRNEGKEIPIQDAKYKDGELSFTLTPEFNGQKFVVKKSGKVSGDTIKGKTEFERNGQTRSVDWEAKRVADPTGAWKLSITVNGESREMTFKLKREGDRLMGKVVGPEGREAPIEDAKCKNGELSFCVVRERNVQKMTFKSTAKVSGDTMKGKTEFERDGQSRSVDWEAKRLKEQRVGESLVGRVTRFLAVSSEESIGLRLALPARPFSRFDRFVPGSIVDKVLGRDFGRGFASGFMEHLGVDRGDVAAFRSGSSRWLGMAEGFGIPFLPALVLLRMFDMHVPVRRVLVGQRPVPNHQQVFCVMLLGSLGEVEAARDDRFAVDDDDLVVRDGVLGVNKGGDTRITEEVSRRILFRSLALIENHAHVHPAFVRLNESLCYGSGGEAVRLDQDSLLGVVNLLDYGLSTSTIRREVNLNLDGLKTVYQEGVALSSRKGTWAGFPLNRRRFGLLATEEE